MEKEKEGPTMITVPAQYYNSCYGCKWYDRSLYKSGRNPVYKQVCNNPSRPIYGEEIGGIRMAETPDWCPVLKQAHDKKIEDMPGTGEVMDGDY